MSELSIFISEPRLLAAVSIAQGKDDARSFLNCTRICADGRIVATNAFILTAAKPEVHERVGVGDYAEWAELITGVEVAGAFRTALKGADWAELRTMPGTHDVVATVAKDNGTSKTFLVPTVRGHRFPEWDALVPHGELPRVDGGFVAGSAAVWDKVVQTAKILRANENFAIGAFRAFDHEDSACVLSYGDKRNIFTVAMPMTGAAPTMFNPTEAIQPHAPENPDNMPVPHRRQAA